MDSTCTASSAMTSRPLSGCSIPSRHLRKVDLPAPLSPKRATTCPAATVTVASLSAWT
jgi:hypothetical protein